MARIDWVKIKNEYIHTDTSYRKLAAKYSVSARQIAYKAKAENWTGLRSEKCNTIAAQVQQKTTDTIVKKEVDRIGRIYSLTDRLIEKLEQASEQLDNCMVTRKTKTKTVEYDKAVIGKPHKEVTVEEERLEMMDGIIDRQGLKALTAALKDLHSIAEPAAQEPPADNSLLMALNKFTEEVWSDVPEIQSETDAGDDLVEPPGNKPEI